MSLPRCETLNGDIPATEQQGLPDKADAERADLQQLIGALPDKLQRKILGLWDEYEAGESLEAQVAKGFDKLETIHQHNDGQNPSDFDYEFNLDYGRAQTGKLSLLKELRALVDLRTQRRAVEP